MHIDPVFKVIYTDDNQDVQRACSSLTTPVVKVLFLLWLVAPITWNGSDTTHDYVVAPLVKTEPKFAVSFVGLQRGLRLLNWSNKRNYLIPLTGGSH